MRAGYRYAAYEKKRRDARLSDQCRDRARTTLNYTLCISCQVSHCAQFATMQHLPHVGYIQQYGQPQPNSVMSQQLRNSWSSGASGASGAYGDVNAMQLNMYMAALADPRAYAWHLNQNAMAGMWNHNLHAVQAPMQAAVPKTKSSMQFNVSAAGAAAAAPAAAALAAQNNVPHPRARDTVVPAMLLPASTSQHVEVPRTRGTATVSEIAQAPKPAKSNVVHVQPDVQAVAKPCPLPTAASQKAAVKSASPVSTNSEVAETQHVPRAACAPAHAQDDPPTKLLPVVAKISHCASRAQTTETLQAEVAMEPMASSASIAKRTVRRGSGNTCVTKGEQACLEALARIFPGKEFVKVRPEWLINDRTGRALEIDLWSEELRVGVEHSGLQHYCPVNAFHKTRAEFDDQVFRDQLKRSLIARRGGLLIEVPFSVPHGQIEAFIVGEINRLANSDEHQQQ